MKILAWIKANKKLIIAILAAVLSVLGGAQLTGPSSPPEPEFAASSCSVSDCAVVKANAMKYSTTPTRILTCCLALVATACPPPQPGPNPPAAGGSASGGASATGGVVATGGTTVVVAVLPPVCDTGRASPKLRSQMPVSGWRPNPRRGEILRDNAQRQRDVGAFVAYPVWRRTVLTQPLDQGALGACVGFATAGSSTMDPFLQPRTNADGITAYHWATWVDQGCSWTAATCKGAYPPNDPGSWGSSGLTGAVHMGWFKSWTAIATTADLIQRLQKGPCMIGSSWTEGMFTPSTEPGHCGELSVTGAVAGGHERTIGGYLVVNGTEFFVELNSWGRWGACDPNDPGFCGYGLLKRTDLDRLLKSGDAELDCPDP